MFRSRILALLVGPATLLFAVLFLSPLFTVVLESFREYVPGSIGSSSDSAFTLENYLQLFQIAYLRYFLDTFRLSLIATVLTLLLSYPVAHLLARTRRGTLRVVGLSVLLAMMFTSVLVKVYSLAMVMGPLGFGSMFATAIGTYPTSRTMSEISVIVGLVSFLFPIATLTLMNAIQNVNPNLVNAAVSLGSTWTRAYVFVELPQCRSVIVSVSIICFTLGVSAFVIPLILGRGQVSFVTNLIYTRFSEVANYPSGAAIAVLLLLYVIVLYYISYLFSSKTSAAKSSKGSA